MGKAAIVPAGTSADGFLLVLALILPVVGALLALALGGNRAERVALGLMPFGLAAALAIAARVWHSGQVLHYVIGGWAPPLGVALRADGLSVAMMLTAAILIPAVGIFARAQFPREARAALAFWTLLLALWAAANAVFLGADLFSLYVAIELLTFAAVPLVCLDGRAETLEAALRYLVFALLGSVLYLLGTALLYGAYGTLDIQLLASRVRDEPAAWAALSLMTAGLAAKAALYPLHLWLPPAHSGAPAPASALLSGLVVKAPFFIVVRLWFDVMPRLSGGAAAQAVGGLAAAAILGGSVVALRQERLKLLVAYSTVAQIGYLFLIFPLAGGSEIGRPWGNAAWTGGVLQAVSHAFAKAAMFMAAGLVAEALGHDRISGLAGIGRASPVTILALALGGMSLMGLPPSGGFVAKAMLLTAAVGEGQWWWAVIVLAGGLLAGGYVFLVLARALAEPRGEVLPQAEIAKGRQLAALALALLALGLGFVPLRPSQLLLIGRPETGLASLGW
jgi:formate hydrogenlyase subunit 3/multisubunit Na+/H+ antiporter MnhD subunit